MGPSISLWSWNHLCKIQHQSGWFEAELNTQSPDFQLRAEMRGFSVGKWWPLLLVSTDQVQSLRHYSLMAERFSRFFFFFFLSLQGQRQFDWKGMEIPFHPRYLLIHDQKLTPLSAVGIPLWRTTNEPLLETQLSVERGWGDPEGAAKTGPFVVHSSASLAFSQATVAEEHLAHTCDLCHAAQLQSSVSDPMWHPVIPSSVSRPHQQLEKDFPSLDSVKT